MIIFKEKTSGVYFIRPGLLLLVSRFSRVCDYADTCLCDPTDSSPPGSSVPGILQARILEQVAISFSNACMHAKSLQSCPIPCGPMDSSPPGSSVHRILQARILEWVAISFSDQTWRDKVQTFPFLKAYNRSLKDSCKIVFAPSLFCFKVWMEVSLK